MSVGRPGHARGLFKRLAQAAQRLVCALQPGAAKPKTAMNGLPPSARGSTGRPADPAEHARVVAREWEDVAEGYVQKRLRQLGIPERCIGAPHYERGGQRRAFLPSESKGGTNDFAVRLYVDSGVRNPALNAEKNGPDATRLWARSRLRDRIDAVIAHEFEEGRGLSHNHVVERVADTRLLISENARRILKSVAEGVKRQR
jgi:hypothetical protein